MEEDGLTPQEFVEEIRKFLRPTWRGKLRGLWYRFKRRFERPSLPGHGLAVGDTIWFNEREWRVEEIIDRRSIQLEDGTRITVG